MTIFFFPHFKLIPSPRWERGGEDLLTCHFSNKLLFQKTCRRKQSKSTRRLQTAASIARGQRGGFCSPSDGGSPGTREENPGQKGGRSNDGRKERGREVALCTDGNRNSSPNPQYCSHFLSKGMGAGEDALLHIGRVTTALNLFPNPQEQKEERFEEGGRAGY